MVISLLLVASVWAGGQNRVDVGEAPTLQRLRSLDASIRATIEEGCRRSPSFARLVDDVERSRFVVYVEQVATLRDGMRGALLHGGSGPGYLRVLLKRGTALEVRIVLLAHELQHAREVVEAGIDADASSMDALFRRIGSDRLPRGRHQQYETAAAVRLADTVAADLRVKTWVRSSSHACR